MSHARKIVLLLGLMFITLLSCRQKSINGVIIGRDLYVMQSYSKNRELCSYIERTLKKDQKALVELTVFWCGGAAGCYDLSYVITQIIFKVGEKEFIGLTNGLTKLQRANLMSLIDAGLEYGDNNYDGKMDDAHFETTFPALYRVLNE